MLVENGYNCVCVLFGADQWVYHSFFFKNWIQLSAAAGNDTERVNQNSKVEANIKTMSWKLLTLNVKKESSFKYKQGFRPIGYWRKARYSKEYPPRDRVEERGLSDLSCLKSTGKAMTKAADV